MSSLFARTGRCTLGIAVAGFISASPSLARAADAPVTDPASVPPNPPPPPAPQTAEEAGAPQSVPTVVTLLSGEQGWQLGFFGWAEVDALYDTTQSFTDSVTNSTVSRPNTIAGDNPRLQGTVRDSRIGLKASAPTFEGIKTSAFIEADFFGLPSPSATQDQYYNASIIRLRQFYSKLDLSEHARLPRRLG
jgi:hypothetical protein